MKISKARTSSPRRTKAELKSELPPISLFVRNRREELGYTQEELAFRAGLSVRFVKEFERGKKTVRLDKVLELLTFLGATLQVQPRGRA
jgi:y4mF family transcriptional regulator